MEKEARQVEMGSSSLSFLTLLDTHENLSNLFLMHQEALLMLDITLALDRLQHCAGVLVLELLEEPLVPADPPDVDRPDVRRCACAPPGAELLYL